MISTVYRLGDDRVIVKDEDGEAMSSYEGEYSKVREKILADAPEQTRFFSIKHYEDMEEVNRGDWG